MLCALYSRLISDSWSCVSRIWKSCGRCRLAVMRAQHAVAQAVERPDPHPARVDRRQRRQSQQHLLRGLVGEGHRENGQRTGLSGGEQPGDARREHAGLAAAGAGQDQRRRVRQRDCGQLLGIQIFEKRGSHARCADANSDDSRGRTASSRASAHRRCRGPHAKNRAKTGTWPAFARPAHQTAIIARIRRPGRRHAPHSRPAARRELSDDARVRAPDPLGGAVRACVSRPHLRDRLRRRSGRRRAVSGRDPRPQPAAQPRHPADRRAWLPPAGRKHPRRAGHSEPLCARRADHRPRCDGLRARGRGAGARAHRGAALARARQLADGRRPQSRVQRQLPDGQADGRGRRRRHAVDRRSPAHRHRGHPAAPGRRRHRADLAHRVLADGRDLQPDRRGSRHAGRGAPGGRPSSSS